MKARIKFRKYGVMKFVGHLDMMRFFQKAMRRADIPIAFTDGYSPHMIMSFAQPLGVGLTSDGEYLDIELKRPVDSLEAIERLNQVMVEGVEVVSFHEISEERKQSGMTIVAAASYRVTLPETGETSEITKPVPKEWAEKLKTFMAREQIVVMKKTKRSEKEVDVKPLIHHIEVRENAVEMLLAAGSEQNLKPDLVMEAFLAYVGQDSKEVPLHYHRIEVYAEVQGQGLVALEELRSGNEQKRSKD